MFVPLISTPAAQLAKRKGGGGGGKGGGGGSSGGKGSSGGSSSGGGSVGSTSRVPVSNLPAGKSSATAYGSGGGRPVTIPAGQPFAGRTTGGGTRNQVYGNTFYGSGYPGASGLGVAGHGLPFAFWPIVWGGAAGVGAGAYLHESHEYGDPNNSSRPGGPMTQAHFVSNVTGSSFHVFSDNTTLASLIASIQSNCTAFDLNNSSSSATPASYNGSDPSDPQPESAVQYYRASSVVLTLDGYNNTAAINGSAANVNATPAALPSGVDTTLLNCLNDTIGLGVPLLDAGVHWGPPQMRLLCLAWLAWVFSRSVL
ncbi:hypothetical protein EWM64_g4126 [Hericium alpestre]|uniref:Uncharacterized protein n=1 Tax=Hericium alpestre TaxID=135208 RepID=A0A4Z0A136_9AGAM|nr:hypothetical protein EWM64_g4126 [Hericium alpestre]